VGIYDRPYYREEPRGPASAYLPRTVVGAIIAVNVVLWLLDSLSSETPGHGRWLSDHLAVHVDTLSQPWLWWQFLTAGFAHSPREFQHILFNMLVLFFLGRDVEAAHGSKEFLRLYLVMVVFASVVWSVVNKFLGTPGEAGAYGASGAISGVVILYALQFPRRMLLLFFVIPIPAWLFGVLMIVLDMLGASGRGGPSNVAYSMHLAGAAFALLYYQMGWNLTRLTARGLPWSSRQREPRLRVHNPPEEEPQADDLSAEVDRILEKIYREGEASLTPKERKILETASREYQRKQSIRDRR
jgi:membrane associated rhomboid family serine protease